MTKLPLFAAALFLPLAILKAEDKVWKARVTVENSSGTKTQSVCSFLPDDSSKLPIDLGPLGDCLFQIRPFPSESKDGKSSGYDLVNYSIFRTIPLASDSITAVPLEIFSALHPVTFGKDIQLLKCPAGTVTVRLSRDEEKE